MLLRRVTRPAELDRLREKDKPIPRLRSDLGNYFASVNAGCQFSMRNRCWSWCSLAGGFGHSQVGDLEGFGQPLLLGRSGEGEDVDFVGLEDVEAAVQADLPTGVGGDAAGVETVGVVVIELDVHLGAGKGVLHFAEVLILLLGVSRVGFGDQTDHGLFPLRGQFVDEQHKFHEKPDLPEKLDVGVAKDYLSRASKVVREQLTESIALAVFGHDAVPGLYFP